MDSSHQYIKNHQRSDSPEISNTIKAHEQLSHSQATKNTRKPSNDYIMSHEYQYKLLPHGSKLSKPRRMSHQRSGAITHNLSDFLNPEKETQKIGSDSSTNEGARSSEVPSEDIPSCPEVNYAGSASTQSSSKSTSTVTPRTSVDMDTPNTSFDLTDDNKSERRGSFLSLKAAKNAMLKNFGIHSSPKDRGRFQSLTDGLLTSSDDQTPYSPTHSPKQSIKAISPRRVSYAEPSVVKKSTKRPVSFPESSSIPAPLIDLDVVSNPGSARSSSITSYSDYSPKRRFSEFDKSFNTEIFRVFNNDSPDSPLRVRTSIYQQTLKEEDEENTNNGLTSSEDHAETSSNDQAKTTHPSNTGLSSPLILSSRKTTRIDEGVIPAENLDELNIGNVESGSDTEEVNQVLDQYAGTRSCPAIINLVHDIQPDSTFNLYLDKDNKMNQYDVNLIQQLSEYSLADSFNDLEIPSERDDLMISEEEKSTIKQRNRRQGSGFDWENYPLSPTATRFNYPYEGLLGHNNNHDNKIKGNNPQAHEPVVGLLKSNYNSYTEPEAYNSYCFDPDLGQPGPVFRSSSLISSLAESDPNDISIDEDDFANELSFHNAYVRSEVSAQPESPSVLSLDQEVHHIGNKHRRSITKLIRDWTKPKT